MTTDTDIGTQTREMRRSQPATFVARTRRARDVRRREFAQLPETEVPGHLFAQRLAMALCEHPATISEYFHAYRVVVPRPTGGNGRAGPRPLEEAWRGRWFKREGLARADIAARLGYITEPELNAGIAERRRDAPGEVNATAVASAERRVTRNERLLAACEQGIVDAGLKVPGWLSNPAEASRGTVTLALTTSPRAREARGGTILSRVAGPAVAALGLQPAARGGDGSPGGIAPRARTTPRESRRIV